MRKNTKKDRNQIKRYNKLKKTSSILWILGGLAVLGFGIYYMEIFEIVFGIFALVYALINLRSKSYSLQSIKRIERNKISFIVSFIIIYSLVNPLGLLGLIYDLYKRDLVLLSGGFDE